MNERSCEIPKYNELKDEHLRQFFLKNKQARKVMRSITKVEDKVRKSLVTKLPYIKKKPEQESVSRDAFNRYLEMKSK